MTEHITSDIHFLHNNILNFESQRRYRGDLYRTGDEMNEGILSVWNSSVGKKDPVFVLGDIALTRGKKNKAKLEDLLSRLNGHIILIKGNHDNWMTINLLKEMGHEVLEYLELRNRFKDNNLIVMNHYPFRSWNKSRHGSVMLHGHTHGTLLDEGNNGRLLDVGWDVHGRVLTLKEAYEMVMKKPIYSPDHH